MGIIDKENGEINISENSFNIVAKGVFMKSFRNWKEYWEYFNELIEQLKSVGLYEAAKDFENAQKGFNGLTDGCYLFKDSFTVALNKHKNIMPDICSAKANVLLTEIERALSNEVHEIR